jgi:hypothetical protein
VSQPLLLQWCDARLIRTVHRFATIVPIGPLNGLQRCRAHPNAAGARFVLGFGDGTDDTVALFVKVDVAPLRPRAPPQRGLLGPLAFRESPIAALTQQTRAISAAASRPATL